MARRIKVRRRQVSVNIEVDEHGWTVITGIYRGKEYKVYHKLNGDVDALHDLKQQLYKNIERGRDVDYVRLEFEYEYGITGGF